MHNGIEVSNSVFYPRLIVWQLNGSDDATAFSTHECMLTIESIARTSKPIVILTGENVASRPDLYEIVEYGFALGLKIIIEARPTELSNEILDRYSSFGPKLFRVIVNESIVEDTDTRYKRTPNFIELEGAVQRLKDKGYELHLIATINEPNPRKLAFYHDYAFRRSANGLICHLHFNGVFSPGNSVYDKAPINEFIESIARMKGFSPRGMYVSPQCVKYGFNRTTENGHYELAIHPENEASEWKQWCLGGKSFAYISPAGKVQMCSGITHECGDLRAGNYDFKKIWQTSEILCCARSQDCSCEGMRSCINEIYSYQTIDTEV